jgi:hypothetical protein
MPQQKFITTGNLKCIRWCELNNPPCCWEVVNKSNRITHPMIVFNAKKWRPCKNWNVFDFIKTFPYSFKFITKDKINLQ